MQQWYLLQTKPRAEYQACEQLANQGYEVFLPEVNVERIRQGRLQTAKEALFARYLFVHLDDGLEAKSWGPIRSTRGVSQMVRFGSRYAVVPQEIVTWLQAGHAPCVREAYEPGQVLTVVDGPFQGLSAVFLAYEGLERAAVFLELLAKQSRAIFALGSLRAA